MVYTSKISLIPTINSQKPTSNFKYSRWFESHKIWAAGLVVSEHCDTPSHWRQSRTLSQWMKSEGIPGIQKVDTRALTKIIREKGTMLGRIVYERPASLDMPPIVDPNTENLVAKVSRVLTENI